MEFELKSISQDAIPEALERAHRYRLLNEPWEAESICLDVLKIEPANKTALITLLLALTDQFDQQPITSRAREVLASLDGEYERAYYSGIILERSARAHLKQTLAASLAKNYSRRWSAMRRLRSCVLPATTSPFCAGTPAQER